MSKRPQPKTQSEIDADLKKITAENRREILSEQEKALLFAALTDDPSIHAYTAARKVKYKAHAIPRAKKLRRIDKNDMRRRKLWKLSNSIKTNQWALKTLNEQNQELWYKITKDR